MENTKQAMLSRSLRIDKATLTVLEAEARKRDIGITVYIRMILQSYVSNLVAPETVQVPGYGTEDLSYPEL